MKLTIAVRRRPFPSKEHLLVGAIGNALTCYRNWQRLLHRTNASARVSVPTMMWLWLPSPRQAQAFKIYKSNLAIWIARLRINTSQHQYARASRAAARRPILVNSWRQP